MPGGDAVAGERKVSIRDTLGFSASEKGTSGPVNMKISVVIPVYNAELYIERSVQSALVQPETAEVILVDDASSDDSLAYCQKLATRDGRVSVLQHPDGKNHGAGASRNLGILKAACEWVAFLDADDFYLPERFRYATERIREDSRIDGIFEATGVQFDSEQAGLDYLRKGGRSVVGLSHNVDPHHVFEAYSPIGSAGYALPSGMVVRKAALQRVGLFEGRIRVHEDTVTNIKLAATCRIAVGDIDKPVAMRGIRGVGHLSEVRSPTQHYIARLRMWNLLCLWGRRELPLLRFQLLEKAMQQEVVGLYACASCRLRGRVQLMRQMFLILLNSPRLLAAACIWRGAAASFGHP